ncbi:HetZ-related protein [Leptolyngbya boryana FACHB-1624]|uniref:HetZ-related protein n=2 Tax=Leptolyngbya group TaxID=3081713 RepID=UPI001A7E692A|nr:MULTISPECIES: HetZ-related protein [unclassified Leptolyngbya]MBN8559381.1 HetZ-related protein [Leptolyngbya sp. UWPOB_LEPTO1]
MKAKSTQSTPRDSSLLTVPMPETDIAANAVQAQLDRTAQLASLLKTEIEAELNIQSNTIAQVAHRIATEVDRICSKSDRIQSSGQISSWRLTLARYRSQKCVHYYQLGSQRGRVELHSNLSTMVYRPIAPAHLQLTFQARYTLIEDFLQGFYTESLRAFRRENELAETYQPRTKLELAEYMAFTEQYAKRRITLPSQHNQQLIILRAQRFASRQPQEIAVDIETAMETAKNDEADTYGRSAVMQMIREQMVSDKGDGSESVLRDRVVMELMHYLESQDQKDCVDYLTLKLQDLSVPEIDEILGLTPRKRDYLQQRFKYHVEKFVTSGNWKLVHEWLGADLDQNLGLSPNQWEMFLDTLSDEQQQLLQLKRSGVSDQEIVQILKCTTKQLQKRWGALLDVARQQRNQAK